MAVLSCSSQIMDSIFLIESNLSKIQDNLIVQRKINTADFRELVMDGSSLGQTATLTTFEMRFHHLIRGFVYTILCDYKVEFRYFETVLLYPIHLKHLYRSVISIVFI